MVLAGGGYAASAWEIGLATGMADAGLDLRDADLLIGTSSGARVALSLASRLPLDEVFQARVSPRAQPAEPPPAVDWAQLRAGVARAQEAGGTSTEILQRIGALALAAAPGEGSSRRKIVCAQLPIKTWPEQQVAIVAVNAETGERRAFDRNSGIDLVDAVIATTAFFGWPATLFQAHHYVDGGFHSSDNADLAAGFDRVLILALRPAGRAMSLVSLDSAVEALRASAAAVEVVHPSEETLAVLASVGGLMSPGASAPAAKAGRIQGRSLVNERLLSFWR